MVNLSNYMPLIFTWMIIIGQITTIFIGIMVILIYRKLKSMDSLTDAEIIKKDLEFPEYKEGESDNETGDTIQDPVSLQ